jgi:hypothetical protein
MRWFLPILTAGCVIAGCGGGGTKTVDLPSGGSEKAAVVDGAKRYWAAVERTDGEAACSAMSPGLIRDTFALMRKSGNPNVARLIREKSCGEVFDLIFTQARKVIPDAVFKSLKVLKVKVRGNHADYRLRMSANGRSTSIAGASDKVNGRWLVSCCVGPGKP